MRRLAFYLALIAGGVGAFLVIRAHGEGLVGGLHEAAGASGGGQARPLEVLLALAVIMLAARGAGVLFERLRQPPVIGEMLAGIVLGPSVLGSLAPRLSELLLPDAVAPQLGVIASVGIILYMFLVGVELDTTALRNKSRTALAISHGSIVLPFVLGALAALVLYPRLGSPGVGFTVFALFLGVAMSITAFPVLARILDETGLKKTPLGVLAISCAAVDDVTAWCLLAFVVGVVQAHPDTALHVVLLTGVYLAAVMLIGRPLLRRLVAYHARHGMSRGVFSAVLTALLASALATEWIGIHALFGSFLIGAVIPHDSELAADLRARLEDLIVVLLLPVFFAFTGLRTRVSLVSGLEQWLLVALLIAVASIGKFGGSLLAARATGVAWKPAAAIGILMNTRGLMELVVLNVGLDLGVIGPTLFTMMVLMAIATTLATTPLLRALGKDLGRASQ